MGFAEVFYASMLYKKVKWCVANITNSISFEDQDVLCKLKNVVYRTQHDLSIEDAYCLSTEDKKYMDIILAAYQADLIQQYFKGYAPNYKVDEEEYFIFTLNKFLDKHEHDDLIAGANMYESNILTDFAIVYYKMFYITQAKCISLHKPPISDNSMAMIILTNCADAIKTRNVKK